MNKNELLDEDISAYYDDELNYLQLIALEARMNASPALKEIINNDWWENFKISNSIKITKMRNNYKSERIFNKYFNDLKLINFYPITFKGFYKCFCGFLLNFKRNNS